MLPALVALSLKEIPLWFLPVATAAIIDLASSGGSVRTVLNWFVLAVVLLLQNYPNHIVYMRNFMTVVRDTGRGPPTGSTRSTATPTKRSRT